VRGSGGRGEAREKERTTGTTSAHEDKQNALRDFSTLRARVPATTSGEES